MKLIVKVKVGTDIWNVNAACKAVAKPIAEKLGLPVKELLTRVSKWKLPAGAAPYRGRQNDLESPTSVPAGFEVKIRDSRTWKRIERAALVDEVPVQLFMWRAIASTVACVESDMIMDPKDGSPIGDLMELTEFRTRIFNDDAVSLRRPAFL